MIENRKRQAESFPKKCRKIYKPNRDGEAQKFFKEMSSSITSIKMNSFILSIVNSNITIV